MKVSEMKAIIEKVMEDLYYDFDLFGIRFENKEYQVGEEMLNSRNNIDREDEREFPEYGTEEYEEMEEMDGTSTWDLNSSMNDWLYQNLNADATTQFMDGEHAYIVVGNQTGWEQLNGLIDDGELLIKNAKVAYKLW